MTIRQCLVIASLLLLQAPLPALSDTHDNKKLVLTTAAAPPYHLEDGNGLLDGLLGEAFARIGYDASIIHLPPERALLNANQGIEDGDAFRIAGLEKAYPNLIQVPEVVYHMTFSAFVKDPGVSVNNWDGLDSRSLGYVTGWKIFENRTANMEDVTAVRSDELLFNLLDSNRIEIGLFGALQGRYYLKNANMTHIKPLQPPLAKMDLYLYLHKKHQALVPAVASVLQRMKADGSYQQIVDDVLSTLN